MGVLGRLCVRGMAAVITIVVVGASAAPSLAAQPPDTARAPAELVNLGHLDFLGDEVAPPDQSGHSTYRLDADPRVGVLWTYAEPDGGGTYRRLGGGRYDPVTNTYGQGAFNADDISRAAVVYLRHWHQYGDPHSRRAAYRLLRGLTYLQDVTGPHAGNVVLWMQPDGTLNPSADPKDSPDPSDSGPSYWLARTIWALGEGYTAFRTADPAFAGFLRDRLDLAVSALDRDVLGPRYGTYQMVDGVRVPAWLIVDGADATAEAMLGLAAYVPVAGDHGTAARRCLARLARGVAEMSAGHGSRDWPFGAVLPWALSRSVWHGWAAQQPAALARAAYALDDRSLLRPAISDAAAFSSHLLVAGGPDNGWLPAPVDRTQIAYGVDSRVQSLLAVSEVAGLSGPRRLAGIAASWYFGNNAAGIATYDPATGTVLDGVAADGTVNRNSGAESTIHGLLSMLALAGAPDAAAAARVAQPRQRVSATVVEAESGRLAGGAAPVRADPVWTGESQWSAGGYAALPPGSSVCVDLPASATGQLAMPVIWREQGPGGGTRWTAGGRPLGAVDHGKAGPQGVSAVPGLLTTATLAARVRPGGGPVPLCAASAESTAAGPVRVDAVLAQPLVERLVLAGAGHGQALLRGFDTAPRTVEVDLPGHGAATVSVYDADGRQVRSYAGSPVAGGAVAATVLPGGFTFAWR